MVRRLIQPKVTKHEFQDTFLDRRHGAFAKIPFREPIGVWGPWVTFASAIPHLATDASLTEDLEALERLNLGDCAYGAANYPLRPFTVPFAGGPVRPRGLLDTLASQFLGQGPTGAEVLEALRARNFLSEHIRRLDTSRLPFPGYHPGTCNDEIHTDPKEQKLFTRPDHEEKYEEEVSGSTLDSRQALESLAREVEGPLYFVLLHEDGGEACQLVVLFAIGKSKRGARLVGVVTQQVCHNLCD